MIPESFPSTYVDQGIKRLYVLPILWGKVRIRETPIDLREQHGITGASSLVFT
jgi:hypothetical protein